MHFIMRIAVSWALAAVFTAGTGAAAGAAERAASSALDHRCLIRTLARRAGRGEQGRQTSGSPGGANGLRILQAIARGKFHDPGIGAYYHR